MICKKVLKCVAVSLSLLKVEVPRNAVVSNTESHQVRPLVIMTKAFRVNSTNLEKLDFSAFESRALSAINRTVRISLIFIVKASEFAK